MAASQFKLLPFNMDFDQAYAIGFLGAFALVLLVHQVVRAARHLKRPLARVFKRYVLLPRIFQGRSSINPTRGQVLCFFIHCSVAGFYNIYQVQDAPDAASRAARSALLHILPLLTPNHVYFVSHVFGSSIIIAGHAHYMLGCMSIFQGALHCVLQAYEQNWTPKMGIPEIAVTPIYPNQPICADFKAR